MRSFPGDGSAHPADGVSPRPAAARTVRRDLRRILPILLIGILAAGFLNKSAGGLPGGDTVTTVVIVRHAEKDASGPNPRLTEAGRKRAARLARRVRLMLVYATLFAFTALLIVVPWVVRRVTRARA